MKMVMARGSQRSVAISLATNTLESILNRGRSIISEALDVSLHLRRLWMALVLVLKEVPRPETILRLI